MKLVDNRWTRPIQRAALRTIIRHCATRTMLNRGYNLLTPRAKTRFMERFARIFRDGVSPGSAGEWLVNFAGKTIQWPLRVETYWLDWGIAVSIVAHDLEVKQAYERLIVSSWPDIFLDVGANHGEHSILFLSVGVPTISFEPNPTCRQHFEAACQVNSVVGRWEPCALGAVSGHVTLWYPETETWFGSISDEVNQALRQTRTLIKLEQIPMKRLDEFLDQIPNGKVLLKIDVEGFELEVLRGAEALLNTRQTMVIFESNSKHGRREIFQLLSECGYNIIDLVERTPLNDRSFEASASTNFLASRTRIPLKAAGLLSASRDIASAAAY